MAQPDEVDAGLHRHARVGGQQRGGLNQAVGAVAVREADMVADGQVIDSSRNGVLGEL